MPRFEIKGRPISIAYGIDRPLNYVFLAVTDHRLRYDPKASDEVNKITETICIPDGGGCYLDLYTGGHGFGKEVSRETLKVYMQRYGVPQDEIVNCFRIYDEMNNDANFQVSQPTPVTVETPCLVCKEMTKKCCAKCKVASYCSKTCQTKDWSIHKFFCRSLPFPKKNSGDWVYALLLNENEPYPSIIQVPLKNEYNKEEGGYQQLPVLESFLGDCYIDIRYMSWNPINKNRKMVNTLCFEFRDDFLHDGSKSNKCVEKITNNKHGHDWRGPIVVIKTEGTILKFSSTYMDIEITDFPDVIDYFLFYGNN